MTILVKWKQTQQLHHLHTELADVPAEAKSGFPYLQRKKKNSISSWKPTLFLIIVQRKLPKHELSELNVIAAQTSSTEEELVRL